MPRLAEPKALVDGEEEETRHSIYKELRGITGNWASRSPDSRPGLLTPYAYGKLLSTTGNSALDDILSLRAAAGWQYKNKW
jgi:hypothetical protein